jgi:hypothetical protein
MLLRTIANYLQEHRKENLTRWGQGLIIPKNHNAYQPGRIHSITLRHDKHPNKEITITINQDGTTLTIKQTLTIEEERKHYPKTNHFYKEIDLADPESLTQLTQRIDTFWESTTEEIFNGRFQKRTK